MPNHTAEVHMSLAVDIGHVCVCMCVYILLLLLLLLLFLVG
jgi:hypothetical protein